jgi:hypothetical protein
MVLHLEFAHLNLVDDFVFEVELVFVSVDWRHVGRDVDSTDGSSGCRDGQEKGSDEERKLHDRMF